jgi:hypothetical protein
VGSGTGWIKEGDGGRRKSERIEKGRGRQRHVGGRTKKGRGGRRNEGIGKCG